jgi:hypothetical protein
MAEPNVTIAGVSSAELPSEVAYAALLPEILAVEDDDVAPLNLDPVSAITTVLGVLPKLKALRGQIEAELTCFDLARFDKLEQYTLALSHATTLHASTLASRASIAEQGDELAIIRDRLLASAESLVAYQLVDERRLAEINKLSGYRPLASDVLALVALFKQHWSLAENKTPVTLAALNDAGHRALALYAAVGLRDQGPITTGEAARLRQKAFTLFARAYDDARRAVVYLRDEQGDADDIAPSLYAGRGGGRRRPAAGEAPQTSNAPSEPPASGVELTDGIEMDNSAGLPVTKPFTN